MAERESGSAARDPMRAGMQMWEAGYQSLMEGWRQTQEFWNGMARSWGEVSTPWLQQASRDAEASPRLELLRELQESAFEVGQAWMRLPLALAAGTAPNELQAAITRLSEAQGRAYQMWLESLQHLGGKKPSA